MKKYLLALISLFVMAMSVGTYSIVLARSMAVESDPPSEPAIEISTKTISEIGSPNIAGTGAYYDEGVLKYDNSGNTIGYVFDQSATYLEFDVIFDYLAFPGWFSMTMKANGFDRTQSPNLTQKGYSFAIFPSGVVEVWKEGLSGVSGVISGFEASKKNRIRLGAYNVDTGVQLYMSVNGTTIIDTIDTVNPFTEGDWFNFCGDGGTSARIFSTKKEIMPRYFTYTLSTLEEYPLVPEGSGTTVDRYNNIYLTSGSVGFYQGLQNYSVEMNMNWETFGAGSNIWVSLRVSGFDRANQPSLENKGYSIRVGQMGAIEIYKQGILRVSGGWSFSLDTDYVFEFGCVDIDDTKTQVFVNINGVPVATLIDIEDPLQNIGYFNMNGDGVVGCDITSVSTKLTPLKTKVVETADTTVVTTYFQNTISYENMGYRDFNDTMLKAMIINDTSVYDINNAYYAMSGIDKVNAIDVSYVDNKLIITINNNVYLKSNDDVSSIDFAELSLHKTKATSGLICPSGYMLKQTYYYTCD